jgi:MFS family permease
VEAHPALFAFPLFLAAATASRAWAFGKPFANDVSEYLSIGHQFMHGATPYTEVVQSKGPVAVIFYGLLDSLAGRSETVVRITLCVFIAVSALLLAGYVAKQAGRAAGFLAGLIFAVLGSTASLQGDDPNGEMFGTTFIVGSLWLATKRHPVAWAGAGALITAAAWMNVGFAFAVPFVAAELWFSAGADRRRALLTAAGAAIAVTAAILTWLGIAGAIGDMWTQMIGFATSGGLTEHVKNDPAPLFKVPWAGVWLLAAAGGVAGTRRPELRRLGWTALAWLFVTWLRPKFAGYQYPHHFYVVMPGIAMGLTVGIAAFWGTTTRRRLAVAAVVLALPLASLASQQKNLYEKPAVERWGHSPKWRLMRPVAAFVRANTRPGDKIRVADIDSTIYWLSGRDPTSRFGLAVYADLKKPEWPREFRREVLTNPPAAIVQLPGDEMEPVLTEVMSRHSYHLAFDRNGAKVWLLNAGKKRRVS